MADAKASKSEDKKPEPKVEVTPVQKAVKPKEGPLGIIPFVKAKHFLDLEGKENRHPRVIVIHCMEAPELDKTAENVANYFAKTIPDNRPASAHYNVDNNSIVQSVQCRDVAYGAKGMNKHGIHIELAGYAAQTASDWNDPYSSAMLELAAKLCAKIIIPKYGIRTEWLSPSELKAVVADKAITGFTTHMAVTSALEIKGGHQDPGKGFPLNKFMDLVKRHL